MSLFTTSLMFRIAGSLGRVVWDRIQIEKKFPPNKYLARAKVNFVVTETVKK